MNIKLTIQYDGTNLHGWQIQDGMRTVQGELTKAISVITGSMVTIHGAGRTDAGVHAEAQVGSFQLHREFTMEKLKTALNGNLDSDIRVIGAEVASDEFHARFSATGKTYRYSVFNAAFQSPFLSRFTLHEARPLDVEAMESAARRFTGAHDWKGFSSISAHTQSSVRTISEIAIQELWDKTGRGRVVAVSITADGFLRYMVRFIVGALLAIGRGELSDAALIKALETGKRLPGVATAPACGLTLVEVHY